MIRVRLKYTSDLGYDWLEKEVLMDESNYQSVIDEYVGENKDKANALSDKWDIDGNGDELFLNFIIVDRNPTLFRMIDNYMDDI
jgi:hypothetical protein